MLPVATQTLLQRSIEKKRKKTHPFSTNEQTDAHVQLLIFSINVFKCLLKLEGLMSSDISFTFLCGDKKLFKKS